ncbi:MAG: efflux RND transporter permease subunit [Planctomycetota bacterium]
MPLLRGLIAWSVRNPVAAHLLSLSFFVAGYFATRQMTREIFPDITLDHIAVEVSFPGASPEDVERALCTPIEEAVKGLSGVRDISSSANENFGTVWVALRNDVKDSAKVLKEVKDRVDQINTFPPEAEKPVVRETVLRAEVIDVAVYGDLPELTLKRLAQEVKDDLVSHPEISQVALVGARDEEITIEVSEEALQAHHLSLPQITAIVKKSSLDLPAGVIRTLDEELTLRITGQRYTAADYEDLVVQASAGDVVRLGDIAVVREGFEDAVSRGRFNGQPAVLVAVYKMKEQDAPTIAGIVRNYVAQRNAGLPDRVRLAVWGDTSVDIAGRTQTLMNDGVFGLIALFFTLAAFMGLRYAFWVCADIPMCFAGAFIVMWYFGQSFNMISLFALIMVGGIIVDDSVVIAESVHLRSKAGDPPELAAIEGTYRMAAPVIGATCMTITMFMPLLFVSGVMGKFIYPVPVVIIAALSISAIEAFCILPSHLCHREKIGAAYKAHEPSRIQNWVDRAAGYLMTRWYRPVYVAAIENRGLTMAVATLVLLVAGGLVLGGRTPFVLLPKEDGTILRTRVRFAEGTPASVAEAAIERIEKAAATLNTDPTLHPAAEGALVRQVYSIAGEFADFAPVRGSNLCEVRIELMAPELRELHDDHIIERWREHIGSLPDAVEFTVERQMPGPTDRPIEVRLLGDDFEKMAEASERVQAKLREFDGVTNVHHDLIPGKRELRVSLRPAARSLGLTLEDVATQLRQGFYGGEAVRLQRGRDQVKVRVRYPEEERRTIADLENLRIATPSGVDVPFLEAAEVQWGRGYANIMHQDGKRRIRILTDLDERRANAKQIVDTLDGGFLAGVTSDYQGVSYTYGGDRQRTDESFDSLITGATIAVMVMYGVLAAMLGSWVQPIVILATVPFGLIGSILGHVLLGYDITMMSVFGMVAVSGIVVNHSLVIFDAMREALGRGKRLKDAIIEAGEVRFQAVLLTSITDVAGLGPLIVTSSGQAQSVMPMAVALCFGLLFSTVVTLCIVPSAYVCMNDVRRFAHWLRYGDGYPTAEMVEGMG